MAACAGTCHSPHANPPGATHSISLIFAPCRAARKLPIREQSGRLARRSNRSRQCFAREAEKAGSFRGILGGSPLIGAETTRASVGDWRGRNRNRKRVVWGKEVSVTV